MFLASCYYLSAQPLFPVLDTSFIRIGAFGHPWGFMRQQANFRSLPDVPSCCNSNFGAATTTGFALWNAGVMAEYPLTQTLVGAVRLGYEQRTASFLTVQSLPTKNSGVVNYSGDVAEFGYNFMPSFSVLSIAPMASIRPLRTLSVYAGAVAGFYLRSSLRQYESPLDPSVQYVDATGRLLGRFRNDTTKQANTPLVGLTAGLSYEIPLNQKGTILLALESFGTFALTSPVRGLDWRIFALNIGASLRFSPHRTTELTAKEIQELFEDSLRQAKRTTEEAIAAKARADSATREAKKSVFAGRISGVVGVYADGRKQANPTLRVERFNLNESRYLLNAVFFPEGSSVLPSRYKRILPSGRTAFSEDSVAKSSTMGAYYNVLNIIGKRLAAMPQAQIRLVGCNANIGIEKENRKLSRNRAEAVAQYLQEVWQVSPERITIQDRDVPAEPSLILGAGIANDTLAAAEHRRTEMYSSNPDILRDIRYDGQKQVATPPVVEFSLDITAGNGLKQWGLEITQTDKNEVNTLQNFSGGSEAPSLLRWEFAGSMPTSSESVAVQLVLDDQRNNKIEAPIVSISVEQIPVRYTLYLAGFDERRSATQDARTQQALQFIKEKIQQGSAITITGYTDPTGDAVRDSTISEARAQSIARASGLLQAKIVAGGASRTFDNATPEGRLYNRFVQIEVKNPIR
jgi:outer membrane protein OmpA-like peptidoglycan-associated protein